MKPGEFFKRDGSLWMALTVTNERNNGFCWLKVTAIWSWLGPMPLWHSEERTFLMFREPLPNR